MTTLLDPPTSPGTVRAGARSDPSRSARRPPVTRARSWRDPVTWAVGVSTITIGLWALTGGVADLLAGGVDSVLGVSRIAGIVAALAALFGLVLTARPAWLERRAGLDRMIGWHRWTGMSAAFGMAVHVAAALVAAGGGLSRVWTGLLDLLGTDWYVAALVAALLFAVVSLTSWRRIRAHLSYETWHLVHLSGYLAVALAFPHALFSGSTIAASSVARWWWIGMYAAVTAIILASRVGGILRSALAPRTTIARVVPEAPGVASLVITGRGVDRLAARPGQFVSLRILSAGLWWQAHPYSLSAAPAPAMLRLTIKALGDASTQTLATRPGTRVLLEGPYGGMSIDRAGGRRVLLIGAGVGLAPMRALLEDCPASTAPLVLARSHSATDLPLAEELRSLAGARGGALLPVLGPRSGFPGGNPFTAAALVANVPDVSARAVFVCGPQVLQDRVCGELARAGVPRAQIHSERFGW